MGRPTDTRCTVTLPWTHTQIGCKRDAIAAADGLLRRLDAGATRTAYADARDRVVYKVETADARARARWGDRDYNRDEFDAFNSRRLENMTNDATTARGLRMYGSVVTLYTVTMPDGRTVDVLAMPHRAWSAAQAQAGAGGLDPVKVRRAIAKARERGVFDLPDMHPGNFRFTANGRLKIIDLGFGVEDSQF